MRSRFSVSFGALVVVRCSFVVGIVVSRRRRGRRPVCPAERNRLSPVVGRRQTKSLVVGPWSLVQAVAAQAAVTGASCRCSKSAVAGKIKSASSDSNCVRPGIGQRPTTNDLLMTTKHSPSSPSVAQCAFHTALPEKCASRRRSGYAPCQDQVRPLRPVARLQRW